MAKFTIQFILVQPTHATRSTVRYRAGDIVGFHRLIEEPPTTSGRLAFVHVVDAPPISKIKSFMEELVRPVYSAISTDGSITLKSAWKLNLTQSIIDAITPSRQATVPWEKIRTRLIRKSDNKTLLELYNEIQT